MSTMPKLEFGVITDKYLQYLSSLINPRPPNIHKQFNTWTFPDNMPPGRPIVSDSNRQYKNVAGFIDIALKPLAMEHSPSKKYLRVCSYNCKARHS